MKENLSSLMDGELDGPASAQCLQALASDPALKLVWNEYHLIGDAIRGNALLSTEVAAAVSVSLQQEPTVLAPRASRRVSRLIPYAMAASFALAGVVGWYVWQAQPPAQPGLVAQAVPTPKGGMVQVSALQARNRASYLQAHQDAMANDGFDRVNLAAPAPGVAH